MNTEEGRLTSRKLWLKALEVAENAQKCQSALSIAENCYCILGVLCETYRIETGRGLWIRMNSRIRFFELGGITYQNYPPEEVCLAFGIEKHGKLFKSMVLENDFDNNATLANIVKMGSEQADNSISISSENI